MGADSLASIRHLSEHQGCDLCYNRGAQGTHRSAVWCASVRTAAHLQSMRAAPKNHVGGAESQDQRSGDSTRTARRASVPRMACHWKMPHEGLLSPGHSHDGVLPALLGSSHQAEQARQAKSRPGTHSKATFTTGTRNALRSFRSGPVCDTSKAHSRRRAIHPYAPPFSCSICGQAADAPFAPKLVSSSRTFTPPRSVTTTPELIPASTSLSPTAAPFHLPCSSPQRPSHSPRAAVATVSWDCPREVPLLQSPPRDAPSIGRPLIQQPVPRRIDPTRAVSVNSPTLGLPWDTSQDAELVGGVAPQRVAA